MILDEQVPTADPGELIIQYTPLIYKIERRYEPMLEKLTAVNQDDLLQAGRIAIYRGQQLYDPAGGASFMTFVFDRIRAAMRQAMGYRIDGTLPEPLISLDEPLKEDGDERKLDFVPDKTPTAEERIVEQDEHQETAEAVHAAIDRLKNPKHRETIRRIWIDGQDADAVAADMGVSVAVCRNNDLRARYKLRRDMQLKQFAALAFPRMNVGVGRFRSTWTSATEAAILWRERHFDDRFGEGSFATMTGTPAAGSHDPDDVQTSIPG